MSTRPKKSMSSTFFTPLRYPGGKGKLAEYIKAIIKENGLVGGVYVEPYAGGAAVAIELLLLDYVDEIHINDLNRSVYAFWHQVLNNADMLIERIQATTVSMDEWFMQKKIQLDPNAGLEDLAFSTFFLNRCNRSGILKGGVIGGKEQAGRWKLDARFNKDDLINRIRRISRHSDRITLHNRDAGQLVKELSKELPAKTLFYLDPPYYVKGKGLYDSFYLHDDHMQVSKIVRQLKKQKWIVSYDDVPEINQMYPGCSAIRYRLSYSAQTREQGGEVMFFASSLAIPLVPKSAPMHMIAA